jgi:hypothetical protein
VVRRRRGEPSKLGRFKTKMYRTLCGSKPPKSNANQPNELLANNGEIGQPDCNLTPHKPKVAGLITLDVER